jgi:hypothetical protein
MYPSKFIRMDIYSLSSQLISSISNLQSSHSFIGSTLYWSLGTRLTVVGAAMMIVQYESGIVYAYVHNVEL